MIDRSLDGTKYASRPGMGWSLRRSILDDRGDGQLPYILVTLFCTTVVFRPDLLAAAYYRLLDLLLLFLSQVESVF